MILGVWRDGISRLGVVFEQRADKTESRMKMGWRIHAMMVVCAGVMVFQARSAKGEEIGAAQMIDVVASGVGMNETEATKDALANAVRQAIGAIVGTEILVQNEEIVRDQILTYSDGFVEKYEPVGKPGTNLSGLTSITIRARIVRSKLIQKAKAANIYVVEVDGKSMFAEATTKMDQKRSALALITHEFSDMPQQLITAEIVGKPRYEDEAQTAIVTVRLAVDKEAYASFVGRLTKLLDGIGGPSFTISSAKVVTRTDSDSSEEQVSEIRFPKTEFPAEYIESIGDWDNKDYAVLAVCSTYNQQMTSSRWRMYVLDPAVMDAINGKLNCLSLGVEIMDGDNNVLDCRYLPLGKVDRDNARHYEGPITFDSSNLGNHCYVTRLFVAPFVNGRFNAVNWFESIKFSIRGGRIVTEELRFDLKPEDLTNVAKIVCTVTPVDAPGGE